MHTHMHTHSQLRAYKSGDVSDKSNQPENVAMVMQNHNYSNCIQSTDEFKKQTINKQTNCSTEWWEQKFHMVALILYSFSITF